MEAVSRIFRFVSTVGRRISNRIERTYMTTKANLGESLKKIQSIIAWFDDQEEVDVEKGLEKIKEGTELIKTSRTRLKEIENEFEIVKKELEKE